MAVKVIKKGQRPNVCKCNASPSCNKWLSRWHKRANGLPSIETGTCVTKTMTLIWNVGPRRKKQWQVPSEPTLYPTGKSWQSWVHPLTLRFKHSLTLQFLSSEWSPQSSLPSQRLLSEMQRPLEHMKKEPLHKLPEKCKTWPITAKPARCSPPKLGSSFLTRQWNLTDSFLSGKLLWI